MVEQRAAVVLSILSVFVYDEPRKPSSETWIHLCSTSYLRVQLRGSLNKFLDIFRMGTFIDSTLMKL